MNQHNNSVYVKKKKMESIMQNGSQRITVGSLIVLSLTFNVQAADPVKTALPPSELDALVGQPIDLAPWAYAWRADRQVQAQPEAVFIERRLSRLDRVYRTFPESAFAKENKNATEFVKNRPPTLAAPLGKLHAARLWFGPVSDFRLELQWPAGLEAPPGEAIEVRTYPIGGANAGWLGFIHDEILAAPTLSADRKTWTYQRDFKDKKVAWNSGSEMVAVFVDASKTKALPGIPEMKIVPASLGSWQRMDIEIEWGFQPGSETTPFDARLETSMGKAGAVSALAGDVSTQASGPQAWKSSGAAPRRGLSVPILWSAKNAPFFDTLCTVRTATGGCTFRLGDLNQGPILIPEQGLFVTKVGSGATARSFIADLAKKNVKTLRQMVREYPEQAGSLDNLIRNLRGPITNEIAPFPKVADAGSMRVELSDERWTAAWRVAALQLMSNGGYWALAHEGGRTARGRNLVGEYEGSQEIYDTWLKPSGGKPDGDFSDGTGALEVSELDHDIGWKHPGTHAANGRVLFALADRYLLSGDEAWFRKTLPRMQAGADWIIRQRDSYLKELPNRKDLYIAGLQPPLTLGDGTFGLCEWRWYYHRNALELQGLHRFAQALATIDPSAGQRYMAEAERYRQDIRRAVQEETMRSPVRKVRDGTYRSFIPQTALTRGGMFREIGSPQYRLLDLMGALSLGESYAVLAPDDTRLDATLEILTETDIPMDVYAKGDAWFWAFNGRGKGGNLPKCTHNANLYLLQDDIPNFLRWWGNYYATLIVPSGRLKEWPRGNDSLKTGRGVDDNAECAWFLENFRNLLAMEIDETLWIARGTPRAWLENGKKISVKGAPTYFGNLNYEIVSDLANGKINATVEIPARKAAKEIVVRFRHPTTAPIKSVTVNGKDWKDFNKDIETITLKGLTGAVAVTAQY